MQDNVTLDVETGAPRSLTVPEVAAAMGSDGQFFGPYNRLTTAERLKLLRSVGASEEQALAGSQPLAAAEQIAMWGQSMDVRMLLRELLAQCVTTLAGLVIRKERLVVHSWFDGKAAALEALVLLRRAELIGTFHYEGFDVEPVCAAPSAAWFEKQCRLHGAALTGCTAAFRAQDIERFTAVQLDKLIAQTGEPNIIIGGPPCLDLSRLKRNGRGLWGRLWDAFHVKVLEAQLCIWRRCACRPSPI
jgi:hypothetical protein